MASLEERAKLILYDLGVYKPTVRETDTVMFHLREAIAEAGKPTLTTAEVPPLPVEHDPPGDPGLTVFVLPKGKRNGLIFPSIKAAFKYLSGRKGGRQ